MKRTFLAIDIKADKKLADTYNYFKNTLSNERIKWVNPNQFHITLFFMGKTKEDHISTIINETEKVVWGRSSFQISLKGCGVFPSISHPAVLWIGAEENPDLADMKQSLDKILSAIGYVPDTRPFRPHLTVARIKEIKNRKSLEFSLEQFADVTVGVVKVSRLVLYESRLASSGAVYSILKEFPLI